MAELEAVRVEWYGWIGPEEAFEAWDRADETIKELMWAHPEGWPVLADILLQSVDLSAVRPGLVVLSDVDDTQLTEVVTPEDAEDWLVLHGYSEEMAWIMVTSAMVRWERDWTEQLADARARLEEIGFDRTASDRMVGQIVRRHGLEGHHGR